MSYIEDIRRLGRDANPFLQLMEIELGPFDRGEAALYMQVRPDMLNGAGWLQGGLFTALSDEAMALALFTVLDEDEGIATISESTSFMQGIRKGRVTATARVVKRGRSVAFMESAATNSDDGFILARTCASFAIMKKRQKE